MPLSISIAGRRLIDSLHPGIYGYDIYGEKPNADNFPVEELDEESSSQGRCVPGHASINTIYTVCVSVDQLITL